MKPQNGESIKFRLQYPVTPHGRHCAGHLRAAAQRPEALNILVCVDHCGIQPGLAARNMVIEQQGVVL